MLQASGSESLVLRKDIFQDCLVLYPESVWNEQMDTLRGKLNRYNAQHQKIFRQFVSEVEMTALDGNGRFLIPKRYLQMAGIQQNIKFIGMGDTIEIWANEKVEESKMDGEEFGQALESIMAQDNAPGETY
jgi:MraZ protein